MALLSIILMLTSFIAFINLFEVLPRLVFIAISGFVLLWSLLVTILEAYSFFNSPINRIKEMKRLFFIILFGPYFQEWDEKRRMEGRSIFCNVAFSKPKMVEPFSYVVLKDNTPRNVDLKNLEVQKIVVMKNDLLSIEAQNYLDSIEGVYSDNSGYIMNNFDFLVPAFERVIAANIVFTQQYTIGDMKVLLLYTAGRLTITYYTEKSEKMKVEVWTTLQTPMFMMYCLQFWRDNPEIGVFASDEFSERRKSKISHSLNIKEMIERLENGICPSNYINLGKNKFVSEDNDKSPDIDKIKEESTVLNSNLNVERRMCVLFGDTLYLALMELIKLYLPNSNFMERIGVLNYGGSVKKSKFKDLTGLNNWQNKRLSSDMSYLRGEMGVSRLDGIDISIKPTKKCLSLLGNLDRGEKKGIKSETNTGTVPKGLSAEKLEKKLVELKHTPDCSKYENLSKSEIKERKKEKGKMISCLNGALRLTKIKEKITKAGQDTGSPLLKSSCLSVEDTNYFYQSEVDMGLARKLLGEEVRPYERKLILHKIDTKNLGRKYQPLTGLKSEREKYEEVVNHDFNLKNKIISIGLNKEFLSRLNNMLINSNLTNERKLFLSKKLSDVKCWENCIDWDKEDLKKIPYKISLISFTEQNEIRRSINVQISEGVVREFTSGVKGHSQRGKENIKETKNRNRKTGKFSDGTKTKRPFIYSKKFREDFKNNSTLICKNLYTSKERYENNKILNNILDTKVQNGFFYPDSLGFEREGLEGVLGNEKSKSLIKLMGIEFLEKWISEVIKDSTSIEYISPYSPVNFHNEKYKRRKARVDENKKKKMTRPCLRLKKMLRKEFNTKKDVICETYSGIKRVYSHEKEDYTPTERRFLLSQY